MSSRELISCVFSLQNHKPWTLYWLIGPFCYPIWHDFCPPKGIQRLNSRRFSGSPPSFRNFKTTHEHSGRGYRSQYDLRRWCMADVLWWCIKNRPYGKIIARVRVVFIMPENHVLPRAFSLTEPCSNNVTECNALLIGLQLTQQMGVQYLEDYGDSQLIPTK